MKYLKLLVALFLFVITLCSTYVIYINYFKVDVVFYASLFVALLSVILFSILIWAIPFFNEFSGFEKIQQIIIALLLGYVLAISLPTVIDRSLSFYILEKLQQRGGGILYDKFAYIFTNEYVRESKLVDIRITEQLQSGTIKVENGCIWLTKKGDAIASFSKFFRNNLLPKKRLLLNEYTDQLVDPFARSDQMPDYLCKQIEIKSN
jgi:hypothetical protein